MHIVFFVFVSEISIGGTRFVEKGNTIYLTCNASASTSGLPPRDIQWFKDGRNRSYDYMY